MLQEQCLGSRQVLYVEGTLGKSHPKPITLSNCVTQTSHLSSLQLRGTIYEGEYPNFFVSSVSPVPKTFLGI